MLKVREWAIAYTVDKYDLANKIIGKIHEASVALGMQFEGEPDYIEIPSDRDLEKSGLTREQIKNGGNFCNCISRDLDANKEIKIIFVLIKTDWHHPKIKKMLD